jgi:hypothetical protein
MCIRDRVIVHGGKGELQSGGTGTQGQHHGSVTQVGEVEGFRFNRAVDLEFSINIAATPVITVVDHDAHKGQGFFGEGICDFSAH